MIKGIMVLFYREWVNKERENDDVGKRVELI